MFGHLNSSDFPTITTFQEAENFWRHTKPMKSGANKGKVPLRGARDAHVYEIYPDCDKHPVTGVETTYYAARMHDTEIVRWWEDDTISIHVYNSHTTYQAQDSLLHSISVGFSSVGGNYKFARIRAAALDPVMDATFLTGDMVLGPRSLQVLIPFHPTDDYLHLQCVGREVYRPINHGVFVGPTRKYMNPVHGKLIRAAHEVCRSMAAFINDPTLEDVVGMVGGTNTPQRACDYMEQLIEHYNWRPGMPVMGAMLSRLLEISTPFDQNDSWHDRMTWTQNLRMMPKASCGKVSFQTVSDVVTVSEAQDMCVCYEELNGTEYVL